MLSRLLSYRGVNVLLALILAGGAAGLLAQRRLARPEPPPQFASDEEHFLFGSIGTESEGIPYWIWLVLPRVFSDHLPRPGGYAALGFISKDGHELPVGLSKVTIGFPRVGLNCAACHAARYRRAPDDVPTVVAGAPQHEAGAQQYLRFLFDAASDPRFTSGVILAEIARNHELSFIDRLLYRFVIIPSTRSALRARQAEHAWMSDRPEWGRGRVDAINAFKFGFLRQPQDTTVGNADMMPIWNLEAHAGRAFSWDGFNADLTEVTRVSALASGATAAWTDQDFRAWNETDSGRASSLRRVQNFMTGLAPPKYPLSIDQGLVSHGQTVFETACASCHAPGGSRAWTSIPADEVGTDRHRLDSWTENAASASNARYGGHDWKFAGFRKTNGYVAKPLDGIWLRAPYLHNGSVPTLVDLLEAPHRRPARFWRGYDVLDPDGVGFIASGPQAERVGSLFDTSVPGNGNAGHLYGTDLPDDNKRALLEFLKTL